MEASGSHPRNSDEWRVKVELEDDAGGKGPSFAERLHTQRLDDEARRRLGSDVVVTKDGSSVFLYAWHEQSAREAERVVRELLEADGLAAEVDLTRWHPDADEWRPGDEPLPETAEDAAAERARHEAEAAAEAQRTGEYEWQVLVHMPDAHRASELAEDLARRDLPVKRRWRYLMIGVPTEDQAIDLGKQLEAEVPEGATVGLRGDPDSVTLPGFIWLGL